MPYYYDDNGNKVYIDLLFNILAVINRTTAFPIYELTINFICNKVRAQMSKMANIKAQEKLLFDVIRDFNENQADEMKKIYDKLSKDEKKDYIESCINDRIFIHQNPMWETKPIFFRLLDIYKKYDFLIPYDIYINKWGREIKCLNPAYVGEMYILGILRIQNFVNCWNILYRQSAAKLIYKYKNVQRLSKGYIKNNQVE